jgi:hypothetical protein
MTHEVYDNITGRTVSREFTSLNEALNICRTFNAQPGAGGRYRVTNCRFDDNTCQFVPAEGHSA